MLASAREGRHTTHFVVADRWGNVVAWTTTIEDVWGSGIMVPGYGFMLNNEMTDFNFTPGGANELQPMKRPPLKYDTHHFVQARQAMDGNRFSRWCHDHNHSNAGDHERDRPRTSPSKRRWTRRASLADGIHGFLGRKAYLRMFGKN